MPTAPVPANKSSHRAPGGKSALAVPDSWLMLVSMENTAARTADIIGRVFMSSGDHSL